MPEEAIQVKGARVNNLKNVSFSVPINQMTVVTGVSGSGKSSLAFDTIFAEGQRRYVESLSAYARQFLEQMEKPDVDLIDGLSPAISIEQKTTASNPRSTVGTVTEIYDYLRLLFANIGVPHCPQCGREISAQSLERIMDMVLLYPQDARINVLAPVVRGRKGEYRKLFHDFQRQGYSRVRVNGVVRELGEDIDLDRNRKHTIEVVIDRLVVRPGMEERFRESLATTLKLGNGRVILTHIDEAGNDTPPVLLERFTSADRAANIPEFVRLSGDAIAEIKEEFLDAYSFLRAGIANEHTGDHAQLRVRDLAVRAEMPAQLFCAERLLVPLNRVRRVVQRQLRGDRVVAIRDRLLCLRHKILLCESSILLCATYNVQADAIDS